MSRKKEEYRVSQDTLLWIGRVAVNFSDLEAVIRKMIIILGNFEDGKATQVVVSNLPFRHSLKILETLINERTTNRHLLALTKNAIDRAEHLYSEHNELMLSNWVGEEDATLALKEEGDYKRQFFPDQG